MGGGHIHHYPPCVVVVVVVVVVVATSPDIFSDFFYFIPHLATVFMSYNYLELLGLDLAHLNY
jgi:hypothetical protein